MNDILTFFDEYRFLSNFYPAELVWDNIVWPHSEAAYQAAKTTDRKLRLAMSKITAGESKRFGKTIELRSDWEEVKCGIMKEIVEAKFRQNPELKAKLLATGTAHLEEGNTWGDRIWGVCPPGSGNGTNWLGKILMEVRAEFRKEELVSF
jgi:ribA/ribD-fused uncharacterized protein